MLESDGWDAEKLAKAEGEDLTQYDGLGKALAWRIVVEARRRTRKVTAARKVEPDPRWLPQPPVPSNIYTAPPAPPPPPGLDDMSTEAMVTKFKALAPDEEVPEMSVRVKRAWLRKRIMELLT